MTAARVFFRSTEETNYGHESRRCDRGSNCPGGNCLHRLVASAGNHIYDAGGHRAGLGTSTGTNSGTVCRTVCTGTGTRDAARDHALIRSEGMA